MKELDKKLSEDLRSCCGNKNIQVIKSDWRRGIVLISISANSSGFIYSGDFRKISEIAEKFALNICQFDILPFENGSTVVEITLKKKCYFPLFKRCI